jgi:hypothetical protein
VSVFIKDWSAVRPARVNGRLVDMDSRGCGGTL